MKINLGNPEVTPKLCNFIPYELPSTPKVNDLGEIIGLEPSQHPFVSVADGLSAGTLKPTLVAGSFSTPDGIACVASALSSSSNTRTSGDCNPFADDASAMCTAAACTADILSGSKVQSKIKK